MWALHVEYESLRALIAAVDPPKLGYLILQRIVPVRCL